MGQALATVAAFIVLLALLPWIVRWLQRKVQGSGLAAASASSRLVSALAVGPQQKVVTVEVGPEGARTWLVLGVTAQNITCLQSIPVGASGSPAAMARPLPVSADKVDA